MSLSIMLLAWLMQSCSEPKQDSDWRDDANEKVSQAFNVLNADPSDASLLFQKAALIYQGNDSLSGAAIAFLNAANVEDEFLENYEAALFMAERSLEHWKALENEMEIANLLKYCGFLNGMLGYFRIAIAQIGEAILIYDELDYHPGKAVCNFNLARVLYEEGRYEASELALIEAKSYWIMVEDHGRLDLVEKFEEALYTKAISEGAKP